MTATYEYLIIGGGITGSALGYELARKNRSVLLLEKDLSPANATLYSYGGLAYWSGTTEFTRKLYREGIDLHRNLSAELGADTGFREIDLLLAIEPDDDPETVVKNYDAFDIRPRLLNPRDAVELEPLLNSEAIAGALHLPHGHIDAAATARAYRRAFLRLGGTIAIEPALELIIDNGRVRGVRTPTGEYKANTTIVCAGGLTRSFLREAGISVKCYFTRAGLVALDPTDITLRTLVMSAIPKRILLERKISETLDEGIWEEPSAGVVDSVLEPGAIGFLDRSLYIGQISAIVTDPEASLDAGVTEASIRLSVGRWLPSLRDLPGTYRECVVAFARAGRPLVGPIESFAGIQIFSGFTSTLVSAPPLARHFAAYLVGEEDTTIHELLAGEI